MNVPIGLVDKIWPILSKINALIVMDGYVGSGHYASFGPGDPSTNPTNGDQYFGLSEFIRTLTVGGPLLSSFFVTKAHRDTDVGGAADIEHFRFDAHDLSGYDEIWLFGVAPPGETNALMSDSELAALSTFMDGGGGVFATGDHEDLGVVLNGRIPRVRSMRKWYYPGPGPNGEPGAPPAIGPMRIETTQPEPGQTYTTFDNQSDAIPQPIRPRMYGFGNFFWFREYPHPLLCGPRGVITVLPDHMHEGEVIEPWDTGASFTFAGETFVEYPTDAHGYQEMPEIVGWGRVVAETDVSTEPTHVGDPNHIAISRSFGVIGAYDGHRVGVGRVAVDSTWHHFFDINLVGDPVAPYPKDEGFKASPSGEQALADIESYYRNIGFWIARPGTHVRLFAAAAWYALRSQPLNMLVSTRRDYSYPEKLNIGSLALDNLYRIAPPCSLVVILWKSLVEGPVRIPLPDPWAGPQPGDPPAIDPTILLRATLGNAILLLAEQRAEIQEMEPEQAVAAITRFAQEGVLRGLRELGADMARYAEGLEGLARGLTANQER